jgi:hypothetical protein
MISVRNFTKLKFYFIQQALLIDLKFIKFNQNLSF